MMKRQTLRGDFGRLSSYKNRCRSQHDDDARLNLAQAHAFSAIMAAGLLVVDRSARPRQTPTSHWRTPTQRSWADGPHRDGLAVLGCQFYKSKLSF